MKKVVIWLLAIGGGFATILVAAILLIPRFVDIESYKPEIEKKVAEATGRSFTVGGELNFSVFPWVGASFSDVRLGNLPGYESGDFVKIKSFEARVKVLPLLTKNIEIKKFVLDGPEIFLEKTADGRGNWMPTGKSSKTPPEKVEITEGKTEQKETKGMDIPISSIEVGEFSVINGRVSFLDKSLGQKKEISGITLKLKDISLERPISLLFQANVDGQPVAINGSFGPLGKKIGQGTVNMDLAIDIMEHLNITLKGNVKDLIGKQKFDLGLKVAAFSPRYVLKSLGHQFPVKTVDPKALDKVALEINVQGDPSSIVVKNSTVVLDDSSLKIEVAIKDMTKPDITFKLDLDTIDLDRYLPPADEKNKQESVKTAKTKEDGKAEVSGEKLKIDYAPLRSIALAGKITTGTLVAHGVKVESFSMDIKGNEGIFHLEPLNINLYKGSVSLVGSFNVQGDKPKGKVELQVEKINVGPLLQDSIKKDSLEGTLGATADITFIGDDVADIKKSLNGKGKLTFVDGAIVGLDLAGMVRNLTSSFGVDKPKEKPRTDFAELEVPFVLTDGVFKTLDTKLLSPLLRLSMAGTADLVTEKLNFKVRPKLVGTLKGQGDSDKHTGITVPILVEGTFAEPEYSADLSGVVSEQTLKDAAADPAGTAKKAKALEDSGQNLLKGLGFGN